MSLIYYYHLHPAENPSDWEIVTSSTPIPRDVGGIGHYSDRIYHSRNSGARFYVVTFGYEKGWARTTEPRMINRYTLHFIFDGKGECNGTPVGAGDIFIVPQNVTYSIVHDNDTPLTFGWIALSGKELELMIDILHLPYETTAKLDARQIKNVEEIFLDTVYAPHPDEDLPFFLFSRLFRILSLSRIYYMPQIHSDNTYIDHALSYIDSHYARPISVEEMASSLHISASHLRSLFANEFGYSPQEAIIKKRISVAKSLLRSDSPPSIQKIAQMCGYSDQGAFTKRFKNEVGLSPSEYAKSLSKE